MDEITFSFFSDNSSIDEDTWQLSACVGSRVVAMIPLNRDEIMKLEEVIKNHLDMHQQ